MKKHCCYDAIPTSCKLVVFDTTLPVGMQYCTFAGCYRLTWFKMWFSLTSRINLYTQNICFEEVNTHLLYRHRWRRPSLLWLRTAWERPLSGTTNCRDLWVRLTQMSLCVLFSSLWIVLFRCVYFISLPFSQVCWQSQILSIFFIGITGHLWWVAIPASCVVVHGLNHIDFCIDCPHNAAWYRYCLFVSW